MDEMSPKLQNQIAQFQQLQQQLQGVLQQKYRMDAQLKESEADTPVYKNVGALMIMVKDKESLIKELEDDKETTEVRVKSLDRQEKMFREKYQVMQEQISRALGQNEGRGEEEGA
jgi:prefoldin beta subunit